MEPVSSRSGLALQGSSGTGYLASCASLLPGGIAKGSCGSSSSSFCLTLGPKACGPNLAPHPTPQTWPWSFIGKNTLLQGEVCDFYAYLCYLCPSFGPNGSLRFSQLHLSLSWVPSCVSEVGSIAQQTAPKLGSFTQ